MKTICVFLAFAVNILSQTQHKIEWPSLADSPFPVLGMDMQGTGRSEYVGPKSPSIVWKADLPLGIFYGPVIGYKDQLFFGTYSINSLAVKNFFYSYSSSGNEIWKYETNSWIPNSIGALIVKDSTVYIGSNSGDLYAFTHQGTVKWISNLGAGGRARQASVDRWGNLYFIVLDSIIIINKNGQKLYTKYFDNAIGYVMFSPDGSTLYFKSEYDFSYLNATDSLGNVKWRYNLRSNDAPVCIDNQGNIYAFGSDTINVFTDYIVSFYPSGQIRWKFEVNNFYVNVSPTIDHSGNIIFTCQYGNPNLPYVVSLNHYGELNWASVIDSTNPYSYPDHGLVCDAEGKIYFGDTFGTYFYCFNKDGSLLWKLPLNDYEYDSSPAIGSDGTLYIGTHKSTFFQNHVQNLIAVKDTPLSVQENDSPNNDFFLSQNYPNPFNPITKISWQSPASSWQTLKVYDVLGREIATLVDEYRPAGSYEVEFNPVSHIVAGSIKHPASGVYLYQLKVGSFLQTKKMLLLR